MQHDRTAARVLRELRESRNRSLRATAADLGMAASYLSRLERGERNCTAELRQRIAEYYEVPPELIEVAEGRIPSDIAMILREHPEEIDRLRSQYGEKGSGG